MIAPLLATLLATATPTQYLAADATPAPRYHYRRHVRHHHRPRVRIIPDPPGVKWQELPAEPLVEPTPEPPVQVHTLSIPATTPLLDSNHLHPPPLPSITPEQARAYCIAHGLSCAP